MYGIAVSLDASGRRRAAAWALPLMRHRGLGEVVGLIGLGLVGQAATRLLAAGGCHVVGVEARIHGGADVS